MDTYAWIPKLEKCFMKLSLDIEFDKINILGLVQGFIKLSLDIEFDKINIFRFGAMYNS